MSIEGKHHYRFEYLKSDNWKTVRIEALAREHGKCQICDEENISNDAHHIWYPESIWETRADQLVILCRACHEFVHTMMPECKTNDEESGREHWSKFTNAIKIWRMEKAHLFDPILANTSLGNKQLRERLDQLKDEIKQYQQRLRLSHIDINQEVERRLLCNDLIPQKEVATLIRNIRGHIEQEVRRFNVSQPEANRIREDHRFNGTTEASQP